MLRPSAFSLNKTNRTYQDFEKPDLLEALVGLGLADDLVHHEGQRPYWNGPCPFHTAQKNMSTFVVYEDIQRCTCLSCMTKWIDVIDVYMLLHPDKRFEQAKLELCKPISPDIVLKKQLQMPEPSVEDLKFFAERAHKLFGRLECTPALHVLSLVDKAIADGMFGIADQILKREGV